MAVKFLNFQIISFLRGGEFFLKHSVSHGQHLPQVSYSDKNKQNQPW